MLRNTFRLVPGIGPGTERRLWQAGFPSWEHCTPGTGLPLSAKKTKGLMEHLALAERELAARNPHHFADRLPASEHWRLFSEFRDTVAYIDIETTGLSAWDHSITTIALYDGGRILHYVRGENLEDFERDIERYKMIVSYNGKGFDVPFIQWQFRTRLDQVHIDLRHLLRSLGVSGGLKRCERQVGLDRGEELSGVDGYFATLLWKEFEEGRCAKALETLLAYNIEDVVNLEALMVTAYNRKLLVTPFSETHRLEEAQRPVVPFRPDRDTIEMVRRKYLSFHV